MVEELRTWNVNSAQASHMFGRHLAVDQLKIFCPQKVDSVNQGNLRCVAAFREHGFSKKHSADSNAVQATYQTIILPGFK